MMIGHVLTMSSIRRDGRKGRVLRIHTMLLQCIMISFRGDRDQMVSFFRALKNTLPRSPAASFALTYCQSVRLRSYLRDVMAVFPE
jgi:hypothetical protein